MIERLFKRILGEKRGVEAYYRAYDYSGLGLFLVISTFAATLWAFALSPEQHVHDSFLIADVLFTNTTTTENIGFTFTAIVQLDGDAKATVRTTVMAIASQTVDTACLERRREADGDVFYRLVGKVKCTGVPSSQ